MLGDFFFSVIRMPQIIAASLIFLIAHGHFFLPSWCATNAEWIINPRSPVKDVIDKVKRGMSPMILPRGRNQFLSTCRPFCGVCGHLSGWVRVANPRPAFEHRRGVDSHYHPPRLLLHVSIALRQTLESNTTQIISLLSVVGLSSPTFLLWCLVSLLSYFIFAALSPLLRLYRLSLSLSLHSSFSPFLVLRKLNTPSTYLKTVKRSSNLH